MNPVSLRPEPSSRPPVRALLFDLGGVILRTDDAYPRQQLAERLGYSRAELETLVFNHPAWLRAEVGLATPDEVVAALGEALRFSVEQTHSFLTEFFAGDQVDFTLVSAIQAMRAVCKTGLLSNNQRADIADYLAQEMRIPPETFDILISSAACGMIKPDAAIFRYALQQLGDLPAEQVVLVDDNLANLEGARAAGLQTVHFSSRPQTLADLARMINPATDAKNEEPD